MPIAFYLLILGMYCPKDLTIMGSMVLSRGEYISLCEESEIDSIFPPWTTIAGIGYEAEMKWKGLMLDLQLSGGSRRAFNASEIVDDSFRYSTIFALLRCHAGLCLRVPKTRIDIKPAIGYAVGWETMQLETRNDRLLEKQSWSQRGLSYGCGATVKLLELSETSPWMSVVHWGGCCLAGFQHQDEARESGETTPTAEKKASIYLNTAYSSLVYNGRNLVETFSIGLVTERQWLSCLVGTRLHLKSGKFKWWEKVFLGLAGTKRF
jgi:hypothetical protein